jgi:hypothetical protein
MKLAFVIAAALAAGAAHAATPDVTSPEVYLARPPAKSVVAMVVPKASPRYAAADTRIPGVAKTSIDVKGDDGVTTSLGFLCGLNPGQEVYGPASARGYDPNGRFVGAKLSVAFR